MTQQHPDLADEQAYIDHAYECLERTRTSAWRLRDLSEADLGGTFQARFERNAFDEALVNRLTELDLGDAALVFGRIDRYAEIARRRIESFHIGRLAVADEQREPVVVDWRAPVAEPFYRATGREPMGLRPPPPLRRRGPHSCSASRTSCSAAGHLGVGHDEGLERRRPSATRRPALRGYSTLLAALERGRTGTLGDIVATIQAEQDEIIRSPAGRRARRAGRPGHRQDRRRPAPRRLPALHLPLPARGPGRAGHRPQPGVPALHRAGAAVARRGRRRAGRARRPRARRALRRARRRPGDDAPLAARVKGDVRMSEVIDKAVADRERPLRDDLRRAVPHRLPAPAASTTSTRIVRGGPPPLPPPQRRPPLRRGRGLRGAGRHVARRAEVDAGDVRERRAARARGARRARADVAGAHAGAAAPRPVRLEGAAAPGRPPACSTTTRSTLLHRPRSETSTTCAGRRPTSPCSTTPARCSARRRARTARSTRPTRSAPTATSSIDEVQDLTPMQLRMATRRSLNGSMTVVGDIAQATGPLAPDDWDDVLAHLPDRRPSRVIGLSRRLPHPGADHGAGRPGDAWPPRPTLRPPTAVRVGDAAPLDRAGAGVRPSSAPRPPRRSPR